jgi:hypothetical protein
MPCRLFQCLSVSSFLLLQSALSCCFLTLLAEDVIFCRLGLVCRPSVLPFLVARRFWVKYAIAIWPSPALSLDADSIDKFDRF